MRVPIKVPANCSARFKTRSARPIPSPCQAAALACCQARFLAITSESLARGPAVRTSSAAALYSCKALRLSTLIGLGIAAAISATVLVVHACPASNKSWFRAGLEPSLIFFKCDSKIAPACTAWAVFKAALLIKLSRSPAFKLFQPCCPSAESGSQAVERRKT